MNIITFTLLNNYYSFSYFIFSTALNSNLYVLQYVFCSFLKTKLTAANAEKRTAFFIAEKQKCKILSEVCNLEIVCLV